MPSQKWENLKNRLRAASREKDYALRGVKIAAIISEAFQDAGIEPILVGGTAVSFYTGGKYATRDIDMISPSGRATDSIMSNLGFSKHGKDFINHSLKIYIEFPNSSLGPTEKIKVIRIEKHALKIISIEDLIIDRLCAFKFWKSSIDGVNAMMLMSIETVDEERLESRASEEDVLDTMDYIEHVLETVIRKKLAPSEATEMLNRYLKKL